MASYANDEDTSKEAVSTSTTFGVYSHTWNSATLNQSPESEVSYGKIVVENKNVPVVQQKSRSRICGLRRRWFFLIVAVALLVVVAVATAGGIVASRSSNSNSEAETQPPPSGSSSPSPTVTISISTSTAPKASPTVSLPPLPLATIAPDGSLLGINPCPGANNTRYTPGDSRPYTEFCNADWLFNTPSVTGSQSPTIRNLDIVLADSFHSCIDQCGIWNNRKEATQFACVAVSYRWNITDTLTHLARPGNCILKNARGPGLPPTDGQAHVAVIDPP